MRSLSLALTCALFLLGGCSAAPGADGPEAATASSPQAAPAAVSPTAAGSPNTTPASVEDLCGVLDDTDLASLLGDAEVQSRPDLLDGLDRCQWQTPDWRFVQVTQADASAWARALPDAVRGYRESGLATGDDLAKITDAADLIEQGGTVPPDEACDLFSMLLEVTDGRPGLTEVVRVVPDPSRPLSMSGQRCADGVFTSVLLASPHEPLRQPLPAEEITALLDRVHEARPR
ncbi:MAG: DUF3558 family protein [Mobilicoccus sp.]|nr:DUF3558 family protein [Mobilicoccus sp.]